MCDLSKVLLLTMNKNVQSILATIQHFQKLREANSIEKIFILFEHEVHVRPEGFCEDWIEQYLEYDFFLLFRMNRDTFKKLLSKVNCVQMAKEYVGGGVPIPPHKQLLITLWWLGKGETLLSVADKFNISLSTVFNCTEIVLRRLNELKNVYIVWPNLQEMETIEQAFQQLSNYPGVIGAIDGCNVRFKAPLEQQESYIDKNSNHSIKLQAIVTSNKLFTNINVGFPGSAHDSRVFRNSSIFQDIVAHNNMAKFFPLPEYHILGDKAYPLLSWLLTPYKNYGNLQGNEIRHNTHHSKTRIVVENTFGILKARWSILKYINVNSVTKAVRIIAACCVLHNFCYINIDFWDQPSVEEHEDNDEAYQGRQDEDGIRKRRLIAELL